MHPKQVWPHYRSACKDPKVSVHSDVYLCAFIHDKSLCLVEITFETFFFFLCAGVVEPVEVVDNGDQTHTINYVPTREGPYSINVLYADEEIPRRYRTKAHFDVFQHLNTCSSSVSVCVYVVSSLAFRQPLQGEGAPHP